MRVISQYPGLMPQIRPQRQRSLGDGSIEVLQEPIYAKFQSLESGGFLYENEEALALRHFNFHGNTQDIGQAVPTNPLSRVSVYDTDVAAREGGWDIATRKTVEDRLRRYAQEDPATFLIVTSTPIQTPYPAYDSYRGDPYLLVLKLVEDGHDIEQVLYYEQLFGPQREDVIAELEQALELRRELVVQA